MTQVTKRLLIFHTGTPTSTQQLLRWKIWISRDKLGTKGLHNSLHNILLHDGILPSPDSASVSVTELVEYCFRASPLLQKLLLIFSWEKCLSASEGYLPTFPLLLTEAYSTSVYLYYSLYPEVFLNLFREQNKVSRNQVSLQNVWLFFFWGDLLSVWVSSTWLMQQTEWGKKAMLSHLCPLTGHRAADCCGISFIYHLIFAI